MKYDFDKIIDRTGTDCLKYDFKAERGLPEDVLSLWVADMDFETAPEILEAIHERTNHGIFGYTNTKNDFAQIVCDWFEKHVGYRFSEKWLVKTPGVVFAIGMAVQAFTEPGDGVIIQQPVYYPFTNMVVKNNRKLVVNELAYNEDTLEYTIDFQDFEQKIIDENVKMFVLCNPHNPVGRVWTRAELERLSDICIRHNVIVVSDEIHCDFIWDDNRHITYASLSDAARDNCIVCTSVSKTFNLAGLQYSSIFVPNVQLRRSFLDAIDRSGYDEPSVYGITAARAAYTEGEAWYEAVKAYIRSNITFVDEFLKENAPQLKLVPMQGTYLAWIDCKALGLSDEELNRRVVEVARLWLDPGSIFGKVGEGFERFNLACPRATLEEAMKRFIKIVNQ